MFKKSSNKFDLSNMVAGKAFLGCNKCGYQLPQGSDGMFFFLAGLFAYAYINVTAIGYTLLMNLPL